MGREIERWNWQRKLAREWRNDKVGTETYQHFIGKALSGDIFECQQNANHSDFLCFSSILFLTFSLFYAFFSKQNMSFFFHSHTHTHRTFFNFSTVVYCCHICLSEKFMQNMEILYIPVVLYCLGLSMAESHRQLSLEIVQRDTCIVAAAAATAVATLVSDLPKYWLIAIWSHDQDTRRPIDKLINALQFRQNCSTECLI